MKTLKQFRTTVHPDSTIDETIFEIETVLQSFADFRNISDTKLVWYMWKNLLVQVETTNANETFMRETIDLSYNSTCPDGIEVLFVALLDVDGDEIRELDDDELEDLE